jgi:hypothetical protein
MTARAIAQCMGGEARGNQALVPGPGHSRRDRSLSVLVDPDAPDGFVVHSFCGDDPIACRDHVRRMCGLPDFRGERRQPSPQAAQVVQKRRAKAEHDEAALAAYVKSKALETWQEAIALPETIAERYLQIRCGYVSEDIIGADALRFHPRCVFALADDTKVRLPALIGLFRDMQTGEPVAIHRTALAPDGSGKDAQTPGLGNPKKMLGQCDGAAIMLTPFADVTHGLGMCEGIETAISIALTGWRPLWVVGASWGIENFPPLDGLEVVTVFADHDRNGACQRAAAICRDRLFHHNIDVEAVMPRTAGLDWNDIIKKLKDAA